MARSSYGKNQSIHLDGIGFDSTAAHLAFCEPFIYRDAGKPGELPGELYMRQAARQQVVNGADGDAQACGELPLGFKFWFP